MHNNTIDYPFPSCGMAVKRGPYTPDKMKSIYVSMRDSTKIALDIVLPKGMNNTARMPTILIMTRYWRGVEGGEYTQEQNFFSSHGFVVVTGDVRGTGASFGVWPYHRSRQETLDFGEVMDWIVKQSWSDGRVVGWGSSYTANTADWMAERNHPALKAVVSRFPDYDPYTDLYFPGGVPNAFMGEKWGMRVKDLDLNIRKKAGNGEMQGVRPVDADLNQTLLNKAIENRRNVPSVWEGLKEVIYRDDKPKSWQGASFNDWGIYAKNKEVDQSRVPIQSWGSWMDAGTANGVINRFMSLSNPQTAFVGAWSHGGSSNASPYNINSKGEEPSFPTQIVEGLCFINQQLATGDANTNDGGNKKQLIYYTIGEERWKTTGRWPLPETQLEKWFLSDDNGLTKSLAELSSKGQDTYTVDFSATTGKQNRWATNNGGGIVDYGNRAEADQKLITYTSTPLKVDIEITGNPVVELYITSTHTDGAFFVYLEDVWPDGKVTYITEGQLRGLHRKVATPKPLYKQVGPHHSFLKKDASPLIPGKITKLQFQLMPISVQIKAGHKIRVAIAGADGDTFSRIPTEGTPTITILHTKTYPSHIIFPIIPRLRP